MEQTDVDLEKILGGDGDTSGASDAKSQGQDTVSKDVKSNPDAGKASQRENDRVRDLVDENKSLKDKLTERDEYIAKNFSKVEKQHSTQEDDIVESAVKDLNTNDETKELLRTFGKRIADGVEKKVKTGISPDLTSVREMSFEREFSSIAEAMPQIKGLKDEAFKVWKQSNGVGVKEILGRMVIERGISQRKPIESGSSTAKHGSVTVDKSSSKEDLYEALQQTLE